jgi:carboxymethylenebutenolidase
MAATDKGGELLELTAADGHRMEAYRARPAGKPLGGVVILHEIFGLNGQTRRVADRYAESGFLAIAPALFDRVEKGVTLEYTEMARGMEFVNAIMEPMLVADLQAAVDAAAEGGRVGVVGFCWGGALAYLAAAQCRGAERAVCYYGPRIAKFCERMKPRAPAMYHFGGLDASLPPEAIEKIRAADPEGIYHVYEAADHAFANDERPQYRREAADLAYARTVEFLGRALN